MSRPDFRRLREELSSAGISPRLVRRTVAELDDHYDDLIERAMQDGLSRKRAEAAAAERLGPLQDVVTEARRRPELRSWAFRFPRVALIVYPLTCLVLLPAVPVLVGLAHASQVARWMACVFASGLVTAAIMLVLQLFIVLG